MAKRKEIVITMKTYVDGALVSESAKVIKPGPDWLKRVFLGIVIPVGLWVIAMNGTF